MTTSSSIPKKSKVSADEFLDSLTGYEEADIERYFNADIPALVQADTNNFGRALCYVVALRALKKGGVEDAQDKAYDHAMSLTMRQLVDFWPPADPEPVTLDDDAEPVTAAGEGDAAAL